MLQNTLQNTLQKQLFRLSLLLFFCFAAIPVAAAGGENSPQVSLSFEKSVFGFGETVPVRVTIANTGGSDIKILRWQTPVGGVTSDLFALTADGRAVKYTGMLVKRAAPTDADYLTLKPGEEIVRIVDLADYYDLSQNGYYRIAYRAETGDFSAKSPAAEKSGALESESVAVWIYGTAKKAAPFVPTENFTTTGCNSSQEAALPSAVSSANYYAANSYNYLNASTVDARYTTWFGAFDTTRYATVRTHFLNIRNLLVADTYRIACNDANCQPGYYAFVYGPDPTHTIYVCNQFWLAATTGTDSKAGTLIHEISHFDDIADTGDIVYGQAGAASLAASNPGSAVTNADNHEYFAEASPAQPTAAPVSIAGKAITGAGRGIANALITITDASGQSRTARVNSFGYFRFDNVEAGAVYVLSARHKTYRFAEQVITPTDNLSEIIFTASLN